MIDSKGLESSVNDQGNELKYQSEETSLAGSELHSENDNRDALIGNLQAALGIPREDLNAMLNGDHFKNKY